MAEPKPTYKKLSPFEQCIMDGTVLTTAVRSERAIVAQYAPPGVNVDAVVRSRLETPARLKELMAQRDFLIALTDVNDVIQTLKTRKPEEGQRVLTYCVQDLPTIPQRIAALKQINTPPSR